MASTVFTSGTVIESPWLNDVNDFVYGNGRWEWETVATAGQTVFNLPYSYIPGSMRLYVFVNGLKQSRTSFVETNSTTVTFTQAVPSTSLVEFNY